MEEKRNIEIKDRRRDIYYEYIELKPLNTRYHFINIDSDGYNLLLPEVYQINYSQSNNTYEKNGHIYFRNNKYNYTLDYTKKSYAEYKQHMNNKKEFIINTFVNYKGREFIEVFKNNIDYIYTYFDGYYYKIYSDHKLSVNEYYNMYFILFSISKEKINKSLQFIKELYFFKEKCINMLLDEVNLLVKDLSGYTSDIELVNSDIFIYSDDDYLKYKETKNKVNKISLEILNDIDSKNIKLKKIDNDWYLDCIFNFECLGSYYDGQIKEHGEITDSDELSEEDKEKLLKKVIEQKEYEIKCYQDKIEEEFNSYLIKYLNNNLSYDVWNNYHIREFVSINKIADIDTLDDRSVFDIFITNLLDDHSIMNNKLVKENIVGEKIIIYPDKYILNISALNGLLNSITVEVDDEYKLKFVENI